MSGWTSTAGARFASFLLACVLSGLILVYPRALAGSGNEIRHGLLVLMMWGIAAGFVHGVGFVPRAPLWRYLLGPLAGWPIMAAGVIWIAANI